MATELRVLTGADVAELRQIEGNRFYRARSWASPEGAVQVQVHRCVAQNERFLPILADRTIVETLSAALLTGGARRLGAVTEGGVYRSDDVQLDAPFGRPDPDFPADQGTGVSSSVRSLLIVPLIVDDEILGLLRFRSRRGKAFDAAIARFLADVAQILGVVLMHHRAERLQRERVKELACLYGLVRILRESPDPWESRMAQAVRLLPPAWQYPEIASASIVVDDRAWHEGSLGEEARQSAPIHAQGCVRGVVEVRYSESRVHFDEGPFLKEERDLLDAVARQIGAALEQKETQSVRDELSTRLTHADRLATLGVMAAEIAHEINEPLGSILGFAQLARKVAGLPADAAADLDRIAASSLHARDIVQKLLGFARRLPTEFVDVDVNDVVRSTMDFLAPRFRGRRMALTLDLADPPPVLRGDRVQIAQVVVNLVVNAAQSLPTDGRLAIETRTEGEWAVLVVRDSGPGMDARTLKRIFEPFYSTRPTDVGTGLGLSVVRGIVLAHGGTIEPDSEPGRGTTFSVRIPARRPDTEPGHGE